MTFLGVWSLIAVAVLAAPTLASAQAVQTQMGMDGNVEVDVVRAAVQEGVLTVVLAYRNTSQETVGAIRVPLSDAYYIEEGEKKKYHVLQDSKKEWIAAPASHGTVILRDVAPGQKKMPGSSSPRRRTA